MKEKGKLVILETGCLLDVYSQGEELKELVDHLDDRNWHLFHSLFVESYQLLDARHATSKVNTLFRSKVDEALEDGSNIIIVTSNAITVDKNLRQKAIVLTLPENLGNKEGV